MCYPCPWTILLPFSPDRTPQMPNKPVHLTAPGARSRVPQVSGKRWADWVNGSIWA